MLGMTICGRFANDIRVGILTRFLPITPYGVAGGLQSEPSAGAEGRPRSLL